MAIVPTGYSASGLDVWHNEKNHGGALPWSDVDFGRQRDGTAHQSYLVVPCPACGKDATGEWVSYSLHPVSGGCDGPTIRELFARYYLRRAAALGLKAATLAEARELVRQRAEELEGRGGAQAARATGGGG